MTTQSEQSKKFCLMGAGYHLCSLAELLCERGFPKPLVITYPVEQHQRDINLLHKTELYKNVFETADYLGLEVLISEGIDDESDIREIKARGCEFVFSLSWRHKIRPILIDAFRGKVFNIHPSKLPLERGSGTFSYRIMNRNHEVSATIHWVSPEFDAGNIVMQCSESLSIVRPIPADFLKATNAVYVKLLNSFLDIVEAKGEIPSTPQSRDHGSYLPLLNTEVNGAIDWEWSADEIERFVRAFGFPYPGAFTYCGDKRLSILESDVIETENSYHPYLAGRVLSRRPDLTAYVVAKGGILHIKLISVEGKILKPGVFLKDTSILFTPIDLLARSKVTVMRAKDMPIPPSR